MYTPDGSDVCSRFDEELRRMVAEQGLRLSFVPTTNSASSARGNWLMN